MASKEEYDSGDKMFAVVRANDTSGIKLTHEKTIKGAPVGTDLVNFLSMQPVYLDLDEADIRPDASATILKIIEHMNRYPDIKRFSHIQRRKQANRIMTDYRKDEPIIRLPI